MNTAATQTAIDEAVAAGDEPDEAPGQYFYGVLKKKKTVDPGPLTDSMPGAANCANTLRERAYLLEFKKTSRRPGPDRDTRSGPAAGADQTMD